MDLLHQIAVGFATALTLHNLMFCFLGAFVGTVVGVLPGLGPVATISLLLPFSFTMDVTSAVILMAGIFYGAQYGGSITAILVRIPGEASTVVTCLDGYAMARSGRAGAALGIAAFGSFIAGVAVTIALFLVGPAMSEFALAFGPAEYTALEAAKHIGETATVTDKVEDAYQAKGGNIFLNMGGKQLSNGRQMRLSQATYPHTKRVAAPPPP